MHRHARALSFAFVAAVVILSACSKKDSADDTQSDTAATEEAAADSQPAATATPSAEPGTAESSMTVADIDRWQKGMTAELTAVREAGKKMKAAKNNSDSLSAMMESNETSTRAAGATGAGVDEQRYNIIRSSFSSIVRYMAPLSAEMDTKQMPASMQKAMQDDRDQTLARLSPQFRPEVIEALKPRAAELRKQELALVRERMRAAGLVP